MSENIQPGWIAPGNKYKLADPPDLSVKHLPMPGYEDKYLVATDGRVYSLHSKRYLKPVPKSGYNALWIGGKMRKTHRFIAEAFIPNPQNKPNINHIDGDRANNKIENLEWCTQSENVQHAWRTGLKNNDTIRGELNPNTKLKDSDVAEIKGLRGKKSYRQIMAMYGIGYGTVYRIMNNHKWKHVEAKA